MDRCGRRRLLLLGALLMAVPCLLLSFSLPKAPPTVAEHLQSVWARSTPAAMQMAAGINQSRGNIAGSEISRNALLNASAAVSDGPASLYPVFLLLVYIVGFGIGWGPIPMLLMSELLPTRYRNLGSGLVIASNWGGGFLITLLFVPLSAMFGQAFMFLLFAISCSFAALYVVRYVPETKGKTLEDIELMFLSRQLR